MQRHGQHDHLRRPRQLHRCRMGRTVANGAVDFDHVTILQEVPSRSYVSTSTASMKQVPSRNAPSKGVVKDGITKTSRRRRGEHCLFVQHGEVKYTLQSALHFQSHQPTSLVTNPCTAIFQFWVESFLICTPQ